MLVIHRGTFVPASPMSRASNVFLQFEVEAPTKLKIPVNQVRGCPRRVTSQYRLAIRHSRTMRGPKCLFNPAGAVRRAFMSPALERAEPGEQMLRVLAPSIYPRYQLRACASSPVRQAMPGMQNGARSVKLANGRMPRDDEITHRLVHVRQENGTLSDPVATHVVLSRLDRSAESLVVVALPNPANEKGPRYPICKIVNKKAAYAATVEKAKDRKKAIHSKEVEVNWAIDPHDLEHRLMRLRKFLEKGYKVEVELQRKKRKRQATEDMAKEVLRKIEEAVGAVPGARHSKSREGEILGTMRLFIEGPPGGVAS